MEKRDLNQYMQDYLTLPFEQTMVRYRRKIIIENILKYNHKNILEIGCGLEPIFKYFKNYSTMTVVEPCPFFYKKACDLRDLYFKNVIDIYNDYFENINNEIKMNNFDFIIVSCLLHELISPNEFLNKLLQICNSKTIVHVNVPNANSFHRRLAVKSGIIFDNFQISNTQMKMQQSNVFSIETLCAILKENNFEILESDSYFFKPFTHSQMQMLLDENIINNQILDGLFEINNEFREYGAEIYANIKAKL